MLVGFLCNTLVAQTTTDKVENVKVEQTVKKCSSEGLRNVLLRNQQKLAVKMLKLIKQLQKRVAQQRKKAALKTKQKNLHQKNALKEMLVVQRQVKKLLIATRKNRPVVSQMLRHPNKIIYLFQKLE